MMPRLWLIGGTQESRQLIEKLSLDSTRRGSSGAVLITVTTEAARALYPREWASYVWVGQLTSSKASEFVSQYKINAVLDMSHPFATQISQLAIALARHHQLPYLRYERSQIGHPITHWRDRNNRLGYVSVPDVESLIARHFLNGERTLLTLGYRMLPTFKSWHSRVTLFARILPSPTALAVALEAGFSPDRLIALRPPISAALEKALWQQWQISQIVTKASGQAGGEAQKQAIAADLRIRLICLARPLITYPRQTDNLDTALSFALRYYA